ncbi:hypothetical protein C7212DRAFT_345990 [Tuber magnatum]|uniref:Uncharacterized protein n=1 Tax=Tuber magnatum TaxID=42249 RepID=A0A317SLU2_9PEZI|nr:hypothetical protein C7212DRAFT_345990 [Tuber magnatum]
MHRFKSTSDSQATHLQAQLNLEREKSASLQRRIESLESEHALFEERENALLDVISHYKSDMSENFQRLRHVAADSLPQRGSGTVTEPAIGPFLHRVTGIVHTIAENMEKLSGVIVRSDETHAPVSISREVLDIFLDGNRLLAELPRVSEDFVRQVLALRNLCVSFQDSYVPLMLDAYDSHSLAVQDSFTAACPPAHPEVLFVHFHNLTPMLKKFCMDSTSCIAAHQGECVHNTLPHVFESLSIAMTHPGPDWQALQNVIFASVVFATGLQGDAFGLVDVARIRGARAWEEFEEWDISKESWERSDASGTRLLEVYWRVAEQDGQGRMEEGRACERRYGGGVVSLEKTYSRHK